VSYGFQMLSILGDALVEQANPFGAPRWLGYDYTGFAPHLGIQQALTTTAEKAGKSAINQAFGLDENGQPGPRSLPSGPVQPNQLPGMSTPAGQGAPPDQPPPDTNPFGETGRTSPTTITPADDPYKQFITGQFANGGAIFDTGGILEPQQLALNMSKRPEYVFTQKQLADIKGNASIPPEAQPLVGTLVTQDIDEAFRKLAQVQRRNAMQYSGRP